jgi:dethiobiotin synthetase
MARLLLVCGTGTGIGKTHVSTALLRRATRGRNAAGFKPIESGCALWDSASDHARLAAAGLFHVKHAPEFCLIEPISPHLAARHEGRQIELRPIVERALRIAETHDFLLVETAGGLFSPINETALNVDLVRELQQSGAQTTTVLVAPNRLGVLHDIGASTRAARSSSVALDGLILNADQNDLASATNADELHLVSSVPLLGVVPRLPFEVLAASPEIDIIYSLLLDIFSLPLSSR